jgi:hypothetical protein
VGAPGKPAQQGQRRDVRRSHAASGRSIGRKEKMAGKSSYRICDPSGRGIKAGETEESLGRSACLGRPGTVSSNSNLRIAYEPRTIR